MSNTQFEDPHAQREAQKYDNPVPSREYILEYIAQYGKPISHKKLARKLKLDEDQTEAIRRRLRAMLRDGQIAQISKGRYTLINPKDTLKGVVLGHRDGFGFVEPHDGSADIFLPFRQMRQVFDGDEIIVQITHEDHHGRREGRIEKVLQRNTQTIVGRLEERPGHFVVIADNQRIPQDVIIRSDAISHAEAGQFVVATIDQQPSKHSPAEAHVSEVIGDHMAPGMETDIALRTHNIPHHFSAEAQEQADSLSSEPSDADKQGRIDLRDQPFITIDGEDARDFDDAVFCHKTRSGGWKLYVAIADVSHYVTPHSALDQDATLRATSVYFPSRVVPMLPEALSNGLCSLKPDVDRLCMVCEINISKKGLMSRYRFFEGVIHSHARLTYTKVGAILDKDAPDQTLREQYQAVVPHIEELHNLYNVLVERRSERGAIEFETTETKIVFGHDKKIEDIVPVVRNDAHKLIEECMLCANVAAAQFLSRHKIPGLFRVHDQPRAERLEKLRKYLGELGLQLQGGEKPTPQDYRELMLEIKSRPDHFVIQTMLLRSMNQAKYQVENRGHFGLAYDAYAHFTSPIRRYPDLMVHRAIRNAIHAGMDSNHVRRASDWEALPTQHYPYTTEQLMSIGEHSSLAERRADDASRDVEAWLKCEYLQDRVGEHLPGVITGVTGFGFFVELSDLYVEGLVHIKNLRDDFYVFDAPAQRLIGENSRRVFRVGDSVKVCVASVNLDERKIDFELSEHNQAKPARKKTSSKRSTRGKKGSGSKRNKKKR